jgi:hypothetical protein
MKSAIIWILLLLLIISIWILLSSARTGRLRPIYRQHFHEKPRERLFLASLSFSITFVVVRLLTFSIHREIGPFHNIFHNIWIAGRHVHHLVWGILLLLAVGYGWLIEIGTDPRWVARVMAVLYGFGAALTLDEFALWLNLSDVYWSREGRESVEAVCLFGGLLAVGIWGGRFLHALTREAIRLFRR